MDNEFRLRDPRQGFSHPLKLSRQVRAESSGAALILAEKKGHI